MMNGSPLAARSSSRERCVFASWMLTISMFALELDPFSLVCLAARGKEHGLACQAERSSLRQPRPCGLSRSALYSRPSLAIMHKTMIGSHQPPHRIIDFPCQFPADLSGDRAKL